MSLPRNLHNQAELKVVGMDWSKTKQDIWIKEDQQGTTNYLYPHQHGCKQTSPSARPSKIILYLPKSYHMFSPSNSHKTSFAAKSASTASASWSLDSAQIWIPQKNKKDRKGSNDQTLVSFWWCVKTSQFGPKFNDSLLYQYVCPSLFFSRMVIKANRLLIIQIKSFEKQLSWYFWERADRVVWDTNLPNIVSPSWIGAIERGCLIAIITSSNQVQAEQHVGAQNQVQRPCLYLIQFIQPTIRSPYHFNRNLINVKWSESRTEEKHMKDPLRFVGPLWHTQANRIR